MMIIIETLLKLFDRDLQRLEEEINLYQTEEAIWKLGGEIKNTAGNLCLHLCGNLQHYIGAKLGHTSYIRNRDNEFAAKGISKADLIAEVQKTRQTVRDTLENLKPSVLEAEYPRKGLRLSNDYRLFPNSPDSPFELSPGTDKLS